MREVAALLSAGVLGIRVETGQQRGRVDRQDQGGCQEALLVAASDDLPLVQRMMNYLIGDRDGLPLQIVIVASPVDTSRVFT